MTEKTPRDLAARLSSRLQSWTGLRWGVSVVSEGGGPTIREQREAARNDLHAQAMAHPMVQEVLKHFPGAEILAVKPDMQDEADNVVPLDIDAAGDDWDPFEGD